MKELLTTGTLIAALTIFPGTTSEGVNEDNVPEPAISSPNKGFVPHERVTAPPVRETLVVGMAVTTRPRRSRRSSPAKRPASLWKPFLPTRRCPMETTDGANLMKLAYRYTRALSRWIKAGRPVRGENEILGIFTTYCQECESLDREYGRCTVCGCHAVNLRDSLSVKAEKLEGSSGGIVKIFRRLRQRFARLLDQTQHRKSRVRQHRERRAHAETLQIMLVLVPPTILHQMQAVLHLPVIANKTPQVHRRDRAGIEAAQEITRVPRKQNLFRAPHLTVHANRDAAIRDVQLFAQIFGVVDLAPQFSDVDVRPFLLKQISSGSVVSASRKQYFTASRVSP